MPRNPAFYFHSAAFLLQEKHKFSQFLCRFCRISLSPSGSVCVLKKGTKGWFHPAVEGGLPRERLLWGERWEGHGKPSGDTCQCSGVISQGAGMGRLCAPIALLRGATLHRPQQCHLGTHLGLQFLKLHPRPAEPQTLGVGSG